MDNAELFPEVSRETSHNGLIKATPMMQQYLTIKAEYPNYILFYRLGDFYEMFFDDAIVASKALSITLTKRGKSVEMCGVPAHNCEPYLRKMIEQGFNVAICEQIEDPAAASQRGGKAIVKRAVTRVLTPGTITEDNFLDPKTSNYLVSFACHQTSNGTQYAIAYIDVSTGVFRTIETSQDRMLSDILQLDAKEILIAQNLATEESDEKLHSLINLLQNKIVREADASFNTRQALSNIKKHYNLLDATLFEQFTSAELGAISAILNYLEKTQIDNLPKLKLPCKTHADNLLYIDAATRQNLELFKTVSGQKRGSLLDIIDYTLSAGGGRLLADRLMSPLTNIEEINQRHEAINFLLQRPKLRAAIQEIIKSCCDGQRAITRIQSFRGTPRDLGAVQNILAIAEQILTLFENELPPKEIINALEKISNLPATLQENLDNALVEELPYQKKEGNFIAAGYNKELDEQRKLKNDSKKLIQALQESYIKLTSIKSLKVKHNNILGYFIEITPSHHKTMQDAIEKSSEIFKHRQSLASAVRYSSENLKITEQKILNAASRSLEIELGLFDMLCDEILSKSDLILEICESINLLDVSCALAQLAQEHDYCRPILDDSLAFDIKDGRHAVVENALRKRGKDFIANNCNLSPQHDETKGSFWLITGPNMGGKSTFLRQNALIVILAQMGSFVPASHAHIGVVDCLFSRIGASDDLAQGRSTFMVEMAETSTILSQATNRSLVILDEIGRGTSTFDGVSIAQACAEYLSQQNQSRTLFATHFHELTYLENCLSNFYNYTIKILEWNNELVFLHKIQPGIADKSYGVHVAKLAGLPESVINRASNILEELENSTIDMHKLIDPKNKKMLSHNNQGNIASSQDSHNNAQLSPINDKLYEKIKKIKLEDTSPRQALDMLYELKQLIMN